MCSSLVAHLATDYSRSYSGSNPGILPNIVQYLKYPGTKKSFKKDHALATGNCTDAYLQKTLNKFLWPAPLGPRPLGDGICAHPS